MNDKKADDILSDWENKNTDKNIAPPIVSLDDLRESVRNTVSVMKEEQGMDLETIILFYARAYSQTDDSTADEFTYKFITKIVKEQWNALYNKPTPVPLCGCLICRIKRRVFKLLATHG